MLDGVSGSEAVNRIVSVSPSTPNDEDFGLDERIVFDTSVGTTVSITNVCPAVSGATKSCGALYTQLTDESYRGADLLQSLYAPDVSQKGS